MTVLRKDFQAVSRDIKALEKKIEKLFKAIEGSGKTKKVKANKAVRAKSVKNVPVKKIAARKKPPQMTATEQILKIIMRSRKGVDVPTLKTKTGFDDKKVRNIVFRASKEGKIKKSGRGIYVGV